MGLFNKLKNVLFEEEEIDVPITNNDKVEKKEVKVQPKAKVNNFYEEEEVKPDKNLYKAEKTFDFPLFDDDDDEIDEFKNLKEEPKKEEVVKPKSMGINLIDYERPKIKKEERPVRPTVKPEVKHHEVVHAKEIVGRAYETTNSNFKNKKFRPSPVISPVYGVLDKNYKKEDIVVAKEDKKFDVDEARKKAFGTLKEDIENTIKMNPIENTKKVEEVPHKEDKSFEELLEETIDTKLDLDIDENLKEDKVEEIKKDEKLEDTLENDLFDLIDSMYEDDDKEKDGE